MRPYLRAANVTWSGLSLDDVKEMNFSPGEVETFRLKSGDILLSEASGSASEVGKPAIWQDEIEDCCFQNTLLRVRSRHVEPRFLLWFFKWLALSGQFARGSRGVGIHHLGANALSEWPVAIPPGPEQIRIVAAIEERLSRLDAGVAALERAVQKLRRLRAAVYSRAFTDVDLEPGTRIALDEAITSSIGGLWGTANKASEATVEVAVVRGAEFRNWRTQRGSTAPRRWISEKQLTSRRLALGDLVLEVSGGGPDQPVGRVVLVDRLAVDSVPIPLISSNFCRRLTLTDTADPRFVLHQLTWIYESGGTVPYQKATTNIRNLNVNDYLSGTHLYLPSIAEQQAIVEQLDVALGEVDRLGKACVFAVNASNALRSSILAAAFSGRLVPQDPSDEPAAHLLERIAAERGTTSKPIRTRKPRTPSRRKAPA
jgi:type I restriction enzyme S subunit